MPRRRRTTSRKVSGAEVICPVRDLGSFPVPGCEPVRRFSWRRGQRHRPGLQFMVGTGLHHGFESLQEARVLLALDFAEAVTQVICQPFRLRFTTADGPAEHIPVVLAVTSPGGVWLIDVRPAARIGEADRVKFAASAEAALACGWRYLVVAGWRPHVMTVLDTLSSQRRPLADPLGLQEVLLGMVSRGPRSFGDLVADTIAPPVARAHLLHLLWHRRLSIDLARPLADTTLVHPAGRRPG
ncbi:MAG TPA: TnsA-like heteromeric transposase endonuclease subunit [Streptosporangiaceae bacterium]|nr:TnsA-like heteromeric transposase endonuclease subunit [Streptosporangiaceae bacterium]